jgi:phosphoribosyl 1,2-cyclic phosphodiesterase
MPPTDLDGIVISHRHLDHAGDVNAMIEGMTEGGFKKKGVLFAPQDALNSEPVVFTYLLEYLNGVEILKEDKTYSVGGLSFSTPIRHIHPVETYGLKFHLPEGVLSIITDTRFYPELIESYKGDILVINVVSPRPFASDSIDHLSIEDVKKIILGIQPKVAILTHFGMNMLRAKPWEIAEVLTRETGTKVIAARDGMQIFLRDL